MKYIILSLFSVISFFGAVSAYAGQKIFRDIPYVAGDHDLAQILDVYTPDPKPDKPAPVLIYVHGGGWQNGDKKMRGVLFPETYTEKGVLVVSINYRLSPKYMHPAHVQDCAAAVRWVKDHIAEYGGDPNNIILVGHSAGAHLVALLATHPVYLKAQKLPQDSFRAVMSVDTATYNLLEPQQGKLKRRVTKMREDAFGTKKKDLIDASPLLQIKKEGTYSPIVAYATAQRDDAVTQVNKFVAKLKETGHVAEAVIIDDDQNHRDMNKAIFETGSPIQQKIMNFFAQW